MTANEIERKKYLALIEQVEDLEDQIEKLEQQKAKGDELRLAQEKLAAARSELTRVSNGCGKPRLWNQ